MARGQPARANREQVQRVAKRAMKRAASQWISRAPGNGTLKRAIQRIGCGEGVAVATSEVGGIWPKNR